MNTIKKVNLALLILHLLVGVGAMAGGLAAITDPESPMGMPAEALVNSPFTDFFIPGLFLFCFIGLGNIFCAVMFRFRIKYQGYISGIVGAGLAVWIIVQCIMLMAVVQLHVIFFIIGVVQACLALALLLEKDLFPSKIIKYCTRKIMFLIKTEEKK